MRQHEVRETEEAIERVLEPVLRKLQPDLEPEVIHFAAKAAVAAVEAALAQSRK